MIMIKKDRGAKDIAHNAWDSGPETHKQENQTNLTKMNPERDLGELEICSLLMEIRTSEYKSVE